MAKRKIPFAINEWYHCYNRGVDKRIVFQDEKDYYRFLEQLYLANNEVPLRRDDIGRRNFEEVLKMPRGKPLVAIGAFCLMPNHFHIVLKEVVEGGISAFMQKLGTAYVMYFNERNDRTGNLFVKPFRSQHVGDDRYFQYLISYVHCNPVELYEPKWKSGIVQDIKSLSAKITEYPYSSLCAHENATSFINNILDKTIYEVSQKVPVWKMLKEANEYYQNNPKLP